MRRTRPIIIGGGPAGATAAIRLAAQGLEPILLEKDDGDHFPVCGGFMGGDALAHLSRMGVTPDALGAPPIHTVRIVGRNTLFAELPFKAVGVSRRRLDRHLRAMAEAAGAEIRLSTSVRRADFERGTVELDGETLKADDIILATGKHELRGHGRPVGGTPLSVGLRGGGPASAAMRGSLDGIIELHLFRDGYAGILMEDARNANMALSVSAERFKAAGGITDLLTELGEEAPAFGRRWHDLSLQDITTIARVPYGWRALASDGAYRVGDQAAVIASLAGDGIAIALKSGLHAAEAVIEGTPPSNFQPMLARHARRPLLAADTVRYVAEHDWIRRPALMLADRMPGLLRAAARATRIG